jgi:phosphoesterase RecJ-like protein
MMVATCEVTALLTEMSDGRSRLSLRSKRNIDVNKICRQFDGGGHAKAAGARFDIPIDQARDAVTKAILQALSSLV